MVRVADMVGLISTRPNKMVRVADMVGPISTHEADMVALMVGLISTREADTEAPTAGPISARANEMVRLNLTFGMLLVDLLKNLNVIQMDIAIHFCN